MHVLAQRPFFFQNDFQMCWLSNLFFGNSLAGFIPNLFITMIEYSTLFIQPIWKESRCANLEICLHLPNVTYWFVKRFYCLNLDCLLNFRRFFSVAFLQMWFCTLQPIRLAMFTFLNVNIASRIRYKILDHFCKKNSNLKTGVSHSWEIR